MAKKAVGKGSFCAAGSSTIAVTGKLKRFAQCFPPSCKRQIRNTWQPTTMAQLLIIPGDLELHRHGVSVTPQSRCE